MLMQRAIVITCIAILLSNEIAVVQPLSSGCPQYP
jgi:hypothetical protein